VAAEKGLDRAMSEDPAVFSAEITTDTPTVCGITLTGDIDLQAAPQLEALLAKVASGPPRPVWVDVTGVAFMGSPGLSFLAGLHQWASPGGAGVAVVSPARIVLRALTVTGFHKVLQVITEPPGDTAAGIG
jgi:anti-anti-sigma factor